MHARRLRVLCPLVIWLLAGLLATPLVAQSALIVVDDDGGPGVDATDLGRAVAGAPAGAVVLVRAGSYAAFSIEGQRGGGLRGWGR